MAQKVVVSLVDDLDGSEADETVRFGLDGAQFEIDLTEDNVERLRAELEPYVGAARRADGKATRNGSRGAKGSAKALVGRPVEQRQRTRDMRTWALANGYDLSDRGRIPRNVEAAYDEVH